jgi:hypothetical protein
LDIPLASETVVHLVYESRTAAEKASEDIGLDGDVHEHTFDGMQVWMPGENHEAFVDTYMDLSEQADAESELAASADSDKRHAGDMSGMGDEQPPDDGADGGDGDGGGAEPSLKDVAGTVDDLADTMQTLKEAVETEKQEPQEAAATLGEEYDLRPGDVMDLMGAVEGMDLEAVMEAINGMDGDGGDGEEMEAETDGEEDDEDEMDKEANLSKGHSGEGTRQAQAEDRTGGGGGHGLPSYQALAEQTEANE